MSLHILSKVGKVLWLHKSWLLHIRLGNKYLIKRCALQFQVFIAFFSVQIQSYFFVIKVISVDDPIHPGDSKTFNCSFFVDSSILPSLPSDLSPLIQTTCSLRISFPVSGFLTGTAEAFLPVILSHSIPVGVYDSPPIYPTSQLGSIGSTLVGRAGCHFFYINAFISLLFFQLLVSWSCILHPHAKNRPSLRIKNNSFPTSVWVWK